MCTTLILVINLLIGCHVLPPKPEPSLGDVVISLNYEGGRTRKPEFAGPLLSIYGSGLIRIREPFGVLTSKVSAKELENLTHFIVNDKKFFKIDADRIAKAIRAESIRTGKFAVIKDAPTTVISATTKTESENIRFYALHHYAQRYPDHAELARLSDVANRLEDIVTEVRLGGKSGLEELLVAANNTLKNQAANIAPLSRDDLDTVQRVSHDDVNVSFYRARKQGNVRVRVEKRGSKFRVDVSVETGL